MLAFALIAREAWSRVGLAAETPPDDLFDKIDPVAPVVVPWWAVQAIAIAWGRHVTEGGMTLDQAFGVAGSGGKGKHGQKKKADKIVRDIGYALEVAWQLPHAGSKVSLAIEEVACRWKVSEGTIRGAWRRYGKAAKRDADAARAARSARADEESPPMSK